MRKKLQLVTGNIREKKKGYIFQLKRDFWGTVTNHTSFCPCSVSMKFHYYEITKYYFPVTKMQFSRDNEAQLFHRKT